MSKFVRCFGNKSRGYQLINLDHVAELRPVQQDGQAEAYDAISPQGQVMGRIGWQDAPDPNEEGAVIVPNTSEVALVTFWATVDASEVDAHSQPVVAWRCSGDAAEPITVEGMAGETWCLELRDAGKPYAWVVPFDRTFESRDEMMVWATEKLRAECQRRHQPADAA